VLIVQVNAVYTETRKRFVDAFADIFSVSSRTIGGETELGGQEDLVALPSALEPGIAC